MLDWESLYYIFMSRKQFARPECLLELQNTKHSNGWFWNSCIWLFVAVIVLLPSILLSAPFVEDSLGTMATAAYLTGHDWSAFLAEDGYFYKYGASIWYLLPFALTENPVLRYRLMLLVNSLLHVCMAWLCYRLLKRLGKGEYALSIALLVGLLPSALLYGKLTWAEPVLFLIPWVVLHLLLTLDDRNLSPMRRRLFSALLAGVAVYAYMAHLRGIVVVVATTITVLVIDWKRKDRPMPIHLPSYAVGLVLALTADHFLTKWEKATVYGGAALQHNTLSQLLHSGLGRMVSAEGLAVLGKAIVGWLFHSGAATFGLAFVGLCAMLKAIFTALKKKDAMNGREFVSLFGILCYLGAFAMGLLFFFHYLYDYWSGTAVERCDRLIFGRYLESCLPLLLMVGLMKLEDLRGGELRDRSLLSAAGMLLAFCTAFVVLFIAPVMRGSDCYVHSLMALNLFMDTSAVTMTQDLIPNLGQAVCWFGALSVAVYAALCALYKKHGKMTCGLIALLFVLIYVWNFATVLYRVDAAGMTKHAVFYLSN